MFKHLYKIIGFVFLLITVSSSAQEIIKGRVIDKNTREPMQFALISINNNKQQTLTNNNGNFVLKNADKQDSLYVSFIGYATQIIPVVTIDNTISVQLERGSVDLKDVVISTRINSISTSRLLSAIDLNMKPARSAQDLMRLVPGLFIAQQVGGGKAEQIFLRGFDADHGTDVNVSTDGMPVNLVSHAHGHGWADLHYLIPETVGSYDFGKGPYYTNKGDSLHCRFCKL